MLNTESGLVAREVAFGLTPFSGSPSFSVQQNGIRRLPGRVDAADRSSPVRTSGA